MLTRKPKKKPSKTKQTRTSCDVIIPGHSSGAAFVHMFSFSKPNNYFKELNLHFAVVNNQYFTHPDSTRMQPNGSLTALDDCDGYNDWPYGLDNLSPYMDLIGKTNAKNNFFNGLSELLSIAGMGSNLYIFSNTLIPLSTSPFLISASPYIDNTKG